MQNPWKMRFYHFLQQDCFVCYLYVRRKFNHLNRFNIEKPGPPCMTFPEFKERFAPKILASSASIKNVTFKSLICSLGGSVQDMKVGELGNSETDWNIKD